VKLINNKFNPIHMIKFFRKIRLNLISDGKTGKYLKYAIGEIILVVIGILIALQINNWNELRKEQSEELRLLEEIKANLETTLNNFTLDTIYNSNTISYYRKINNYIEKDLPYNNDLDSAFSAIGLFSSPYTINTAYKTLLSKGIDIIQNKTLKEKITNFYEVEAMSLLVDVDRAEWSLTDNVVSPFFSKQIRRIDTTSLNIARPIDFESLKHNDEFINILGLLIRERRKNILYQKNCMLSIQNLIESINTELETRNK